MYALQLSEQYHKVKTTISVLLCPLLISEVPLKTMEDEAEDNLATEKKKAHE